MTEQEGQQLLNDTTGRVKWQCYSRVYTYAQVKVAYRKKYNADPGVVAEKDGMWWLGPVPEKEEAQP